VERILVAVISALAGGTLSGVLAMSNTAGRLTAVEATLQRIELRLDAVAHKP
jgi:type II secretory pathway pseudopilin PulG